MVVAEAARGGSKSEPWMPWMPWSAAVYDYNSKNESKYDPEGYCLPPGGPRMMATPYQMEIIQQPEHKRIIMIFEGATHIWREIYMDGRKFPEGDELNPDVSRLLGRPDGERPTRSSSRTRASTRTAGSITSATRTRTRWKSSSGGRVRTSRRCTTRRRSTIRARTRGRSRWRGTSRGRDGGELPEYICQENNRYLNRLEDDLGQPIFGPRPQPGLKRPAGTR